MNSIENGSAALIVIGGFAGTGKTSLSKRLAAEFGIPRLSSDAIGRTISLLQGIQGQSVNATEIAFDVIFDLCAEFLRHGISTILDLNIGWAFQWEHLERLDRPDIHVVDAARSEDEVYASIKQYLAQISLPPQLTNES